jgi:SAM-dependent methyltransferase
MLNNITHIVDGYLNLAAAAKTALRRSKPSAPLKLLLDDHQIIGRVLDYGCGHGADVAHLKSLGYDVVGWDPTWSTDIPQGKFDTVLCTYVLNVVSERDADEIAKATREYLRNDKCGGKIFYTVRADTKDTDTQRLVTAIPKAKVHIKSSGFVVWCYEQ